MFEEACVRVSERYGIPPERVMNAAYEYIDGGFKWQDAVELVDDDARYAEPIDGCFPARWPAEYLD